MATNWKYFDFSHNNPELGGHTFDLIFKGAPPEYATNNAGQLLLSTFKKIYPNVKSITTAPTSPGEQWGYTTENWSNSVYLIVDWHYRITFHNSPQWKSGWIYLTNMWDPVDNLGTWNGSGNSPYTWNANWATGNQGSELEMRLMVDNRYVLQVKSHIGDDGIANNGDDASWATMGGWDNWQEKQTWKLPNWTPERQIRLIRYNHGGPAAILGVVYWNGQTYKTGLDTSWRMAKDVSPNDNQGSNSSGANHWHRKAWASNGAWGNWPDYHPEFFNPSAAWIDAHSVSTNQYMDFRWAVPAVCPTITQTPTDPVPTVLDNINLSINDDGVNVDTYTWTQVGGTSPNIPQLDGGLTGPSISFPLPLNSGETGPLKVKLKATGNDPSFNYSPWTYIDGDTQAERIFTLQFTEAADAEPQIDYVGFDNELRVGSDGEPEDSEYTKGDLIKLTGRESLNAKTYQWEVVGSSWPDITFTNPNGIDTYITVPYSDILDYEDIEIKLTCTNIENEPVSITKVLNVVVPLPTVPNIVVKSDNPEGEDKFYVGDVVTMTNQQLEGGPPITFEWVQMQGPILDIQGEDTFVCRYQIPEGAMGDTIQFQLTTGNIEDVKTSTTNTITVLERPLSWPKITKISPDYDNNSPETIVRGEVVNMSANESIGATQFEWYVLEGPVTQLSNPTSPNCSFTVADNAPPGAYVRIALNTWNVEGVMSNGSEAPYINESPGSDIEFYIFNEQPAVISEVIQLPANNPLPGHSVSLQAIVQSGNPVSWNWTQVSGVPAQIMNGNTDTIQFMVPEEAGFGVAEDETSDLVFQVVCTNSEGDLSNMFSHTVVLEIPTDPWVHLLPHLTNHPEFNSGSADIADVQSYFYDTTVPEANHSMTDDTDWNIPRYLEQFNVTGGSANPTMEDVTAFLEHDRLDAANAILWFMQNNVWPPSQATLEWQSVLTDVVIGGWPQTTPDNGWVVDEYNAIENHFLEEYDIDGSGNLPTQADIQEWYNRGRPDVAHVINWMILNDTYPLSSGYEPPPPPMPGASIYAEINPSTEVNVGATVYLSSPNTFVEDPINPGQMLSGAEAELQYQWIQTMGPSVNIVNSNTDLANFIMPVDVMDEELFEFKLVVTNTEGLSAEVTHGSLNPDGLTIDLQITAVAPDSYWQTLLGGPESILNEMNLQGETIPKWGYYNIIEVGGDVNTQRNRWYNEFNITGDGNLNQEDIAFWYENGRPDVANAIEYFIATGEFPPIQSDVPSTVPFTFTITSNWPEGVSNIVTAAQNLTSIEEVPGFTGGVGGGYASFVLAPEIDNFNTWVSENAEGYRYTNTFAGAPFAVAKVNETMGDEHGGPQYEGGPFTMSPGMTVYLDGTDSLNQTSYLWQQIEGPQVSLQNPDTGTPSFIMPGGENGTTITFQLQVGNTDGIQSSTDHEESRVSLDVFVPEGFWDSFLYGIDMNTPTSYYGNGVYTPDWLAEHPNLPPYNNQDFVGQPMVFYYEDFKLTGGSEITQADIDMWAEVGRDDVVEAIWYFMSTQNWPIHRPPAPPPPDEYRHFPGHIPAGMGTPVQEELTLNQMVDVLYLEGYTEWNHLDVNGDGIIDEADGNAIIQSTLSDTGIGDARPLDFIRQVYVTNQTIMFELYFPPGGTTVVEDEEAPPSTDADPILLVPPGTSKAFYVDEQGELEGYEVITRQRKRQVAYFTDGVTSTLESVNIYTASMKSTNNPYYINVSDGNPISSSSETQFSVAFGHYAGSGSENLPNSIGASEAIYKQYSQLLLPYSESSQGNRFYITSGSDVTSDGTFGNVDEHIYVINFKRNRFKDEIQPGTWTLTLSSSKSVVGVEEKRQLKLTDNSKFDRESAVATPAGIRYSIYSGSAGEIENTNTRYGWFYPEVGVMVFGEALANQYQGGTRGQLNSTPGQVSFNPSSTGYGDLNTGLSPILSSSVDCRNALKLVNAMRMVSGSALTLNGLKEEQLVTYVCKLGAQEFNHTTNHSILSSSGATMFSKTPGRRNGFLITTSSADNSLGYTSSYDNTFYSKGSSTMDSNPHTYITQVLLYGDDGVPIAVANLSKPLLNNFTKEGVIKVQLAF